MNLFMMFLDYHEKRINPNKWNSNSGGDKTSIFIDKVPFTRHPWIELIYNNTNAKEEGTYFPVKATKKGHKN